MAINESWKLTLDALDAPEVGDPADVALPGRVAIRATWIGVVSNERELGDAMVLMAAICDEREAESAE